MIGESDISSVGALGEAGGVEQTQEGGVSWEGHRHGSNLFHYCPWGRGWGGTDFI